MNSVIEKLAAIEQEVAAIQPAMEPLTERIAALDQKVTGFAQQLTGLAAESAAIRQDIELTRKGLVRIQTLIGESKVESEQFAAGQEESLQRCETMTAVFGAAFQAVSQFFETAQRMGLADQAKAVFLSPVPPPTAKILPSVPVLPDPPMPKFVPETAPVPEPAVLKPAVSEPVVSEPAVPEIPPVRELPSISEPFSAAPVIEEFDDVEEFEEVEEPPVAEPPFEEPEAMESPSVESVFSESDFDSAIPDADEAEIVPWSVPDLPDVTALSAMDSGHLDSESAAFTEEPEPSSEMASHLEVPPLNLSAPALPEPSEPEEADETDEQEIEAMLATMMAPVTAAAQ